jgi:hypothetical protein
VLHATWQLAAAQEAAAEAVAATPDYLPKVVRLLRGVLTVADGVRDDAMLQPSHARAATYATALLAVVADASEAGAAAVAAVAEAVDTLVALVCLDVASEPAPGWRGEQRRAARDRDGDGEGERGYGGDVTPRFSRRVSGGGEAEWAMVCELMAEAKTQAGLALGAIAQAREAMGGELERRLAEAVRPLSELLGGPSGAARSAASPTRSPTRRQRQPRVVAAAAEAVARLAAAAAAAPGGAVALALEAALEPHGGGGLLDRLLGVITRLGGSVSPGEVPSLPALPCPAPPTAVLSLTFLLPPTLNND